MAMGWDVSRAISTAAVVGILSLAIAQPGTAAAQDVDAALRAIGAETIRGIDSDIALPATAEEYEALGKYAVLQLTASTAVATELPLRAVYVMYKGVRVSLQRVDLRPVTQVSAAGKATQASYYLLPIQLMKRDAALKADFAGARVGFGIMTFSAKSGLDADAPAFARLDEYDNPGEPDMDAVRQLIAREFLD